MKRTQNLALFAIVCVAASPLLRAADDPTDIPPVIVTGTFIDGGAAACRGASCAMELYGAAMRNSTLSPEKTLDAEIVVDRAVFCTALKGKRPPNCSLSSPPSTPGLDPGWAPNGCGTGGITNLLLDGGLSLAYQEHYSGNLDAPYGGISFKASCDQHDACWGVGGNRATCDMSFDGSMRNACGAMISASSQTICFAFAGAYFSAVAASDIGNGNYTAAVAARQCALWAYDMKQNGCK